MHVVALSGGKDSTALALRLRELNPDIDYTFVCTPTGDELPEMFAHWRRLGELLGKRITPVTNIKGLKGVIREQKMLPNFRARFCTRRTAPTVRGATTKGSVSGGHCGRTIPAYGRMRSATRRKWAQPTARRAETHGPPRFVICARNSRAGASRSRSRKRRTACAMSVNAGYARYKRKIS